MPIGPQEVRIGTQNPAAKLNEEKVRQMRRDRKNGAKVKELKAKYGVSIGVVSQVCRYMIWSHVRDDEP